eukprot:704511_1
MDAIINAPDFCLLNHTELQRRHIMRSTTLNVTKQHGYYTLNYGGSDGGCKDRISSMDNSQACQCTRNRIQKSGHYGAIKRSKTPFNVMTRSLI